MKSLPESFLRYEHRAGTRQDCAKSSGNDGGSGTGSLSLSRWSRLDEAPGLIKLAKTWSR